MNKSLHMYIISKNDCLKVLFHLVGSVYCTVHSYVSDHHGCSTKCMVVVYGKNNKKKSSNSTDKRNYIQLLPYRLKLGKYEITGNDVSHHHLELLKRFT